MEKEKQCRRLPSSYADTANKQIDADTERLSKQREATSPHALDVFSLPLSPLIEEGRKKALSFHRPFFLAFFQTQHSSIFSIPTTQRYLRLRICASAAGASEYFMRAVGGREVYSSASSLHNTDISAYSG